MMHTQLRAALDRLKAIHGEMTPYLIKTYREQHPGVSLGDAALALAGEPTYDELRAERDALRAALDAVAEHLRPALEAEAGATAGPWEEHEDIDEGFWVESRDGGMVIVDTGLHIWPHEADLNLVLALRNALPAVRAELDKVRP